MKNLSFYFAAVLAVVGSPAMSGAGVMVTNTLETEYHHDNKNDKTEDDHFGAIKDRLNIVGSAGDISTWARFDMSTFIDQPSTKYQPKLLPERLSIKYKLGNWAFTAGDYYTQIGRGIALSLRKADEVATDITLRGGQIEYSSKMQMLKVFGGWVNTSNLDPVTMQYVANADDKIGGLLYEFRGLDAFNAAVFGVATEREYRLLTTERPDASQTGGFYIDAPQITDWLSFYLEGDIQHKWLAGASQDLGYAGYLSADLMFGDASFLLEGLAMSGFSQEGSQNSVTNTFFLYNRPPTLERINDEVPSITDVVGGRVRAEYYFEAAGLSLYVNGLYRINALGEPTSIEEIHGYGGLELTFQGGASRLKLEGGYRQDVQLPYDDAVSGVSVERKTVKNMMHYYLDYVQKLWPKYSLHLISDTEFRAQEDPSATDDSLRDSIRGSSFIGIEKAGLGDITFEFGYDTVDQSADARTLYYAGIVSWSITNTMKIRATGGTQRGGLKCVAGVCRVFPSFAGGKAEFVARF